MSSVNGDRVHMSNEYLTKKELEHKDIRKYLSKISNYIDISDEILEDDEFVVDDADEYRQGICQLFAYELNQKYGYPVFIIKKDKHPHIFCKSKDGKYYIDVRGITDDFTEFLQSLEYSYDTDVKVEPYEFVEEDFKEKYTKIYEVFARIIIQEDIERYIVPEV